MTDHLPECGTNDGSMFCICSALRACEQRVRQESSTPSYLCVECWHRQEGHSCETPERCMCRDCNYAAALDAAREAVAALEPLLDRSKYEGGYDCCGCATVGYLLADALDAIDALKENE